MNQRKAKKLRNIARGAIANSEVTYDTTEYTKNVQVGFGVSLPMKVYTATLKEDSQRALYKKLKKAS
jgi:hypothetical protein